MGKDPATATRQEKRSLVCAQCHVTYVIPKDKEMKSVGVFFPWQGSKVGDISVENIIKVIKSDPAYLEWKQNVTGFKLGFSGTRNMSFTAGTASTGRPMSPAPTATCRIRGWGPTRFPTTTSGSPLKQDMMACQQCHTETAEWLKDQVIAIQDRTISLMNRAGYATAVAAKLFESGPQGPGRRQEDRPRPV